MDQLARKLAQYALGAIDADFPRLARARAVDAITDCVACMLAGSREPLAKMVLNVASPAPTEAARGLLLGTTRYSTPADSALYNGAIAHALDYDDTNHPGIAHPSAPLVSAMLAVAPMARSRGRDLVSAYILGLEVIGKLGRALNTAHYKQGWHATATFGTLAAAVAAGRLLRLTEQEMVMAIGIAASAAGGLRANFGTMVKPLHAGYAARNGVLAVLLAREGLTANEAALEHRYGYCNVFNHGIGYDPEPLAAWGKPLEILTEFSLALKPFPSCGATHTGIEAALLLREEIGGAPIRSVRAGVSEMAFEPLIYVMPNSGLEGKFSLHYCIAAALTDGVVNFATFSDEKAADPTIRALIPKIKMEADDRVRHDPEYATVVTVETESSGRHERLVPLAIGKPARWFSRQQLRDKFFDCGTRACAPEPLERIFGVLQSIDGDTQVDNLLSTLRGAFQE